MAKVKRVKRARKRIKKKKAPQKGRGFDIVGWASKKFNPPELHWPNYKYLGPFTKLKRRLQNNDRPLNPLDAIAKAHDIAYSEADRLAKSPAQRKKMKWSADAQMVNSIDRMKNKSVAARVSRTIIDLKRRAGL